MKIRFFILLICGLFSLSACGGGGGGNSAPVVSNSSAAGLYDVSTDTGRSASGLILDDGTFYILYSMVGLPNTIGGVVQGNSAANNGTFTSSNARDFNLEGAGVISATISGNYTPKQSINGTITYSTIPDVASFNGTYNSAYELVPSLTNVAGVYSGEVAYSLGNENASVTVSSNGTISGIGTSGCSMTGNLTPRVNGNVYNVSITFGGDPCFFTNQTMEGIGYFDAVNNQLFAATPNASRNDGILFVGTK